MRTRPKKRFAAMAAILPAALVAMNLFTPVAKADPVPTTMRVTTDPVIGTYGDNVALNAKLRSEDDKIAGKTVVFSLNGTEVGSDTTNNGGNAKLTAVPLTGIAAGTYATGVSASWAGDGEFGPSSDTGSLIVEKRPITVTADPQTKAAGDADPPLTFELTEGSLVDGDSLTGALTRKAGQAAGIYPIKKGTLTAGSNYVMTYVGDSLTITGVAGKIFVKSTVSIFYGSPFHGKVKSTVKKCFRKRLVKVLKKRDGKDKLIDKDLTSRRGKYSVRGGQGRTGKYYSKATKKSFTKQNGTTVVCRRSLSSVLNLL
jgi:hypothetical protein